jgi:NADH-quinone oxidoreductase subunit J
MSLLAQTTQATQVETISVVLFYLFGAISAVSALGVVASRNIVRTAVFLLFTLIGVAGLYFLLESEFLAAVQLVVYAGGTLILILFGVMLTSKSPFSRFEPKAGEVVIAVAVTLVLFTALVMAIFDAHFVPHFMDTTLKYPARDLGQALLGDYLVPFELASVVLLVVMIGAAYLAKARRKDDAPATRGTVTLEEKVKQWN